MTNVAACNRKQPISLLCGLVMPRKCGPSIGCRTVGQNVFDRSFHGDVELCIPREYGGCDARLRGKRKAHDCLVGCGRRRGECDEFVDKILNRRIDRILVEIT